MSFDYDISNIKYCCFTTVDFNHPDQSSVYRCSKDNGDRPGGIQCDKCNVWICSLHYEITNCPQCGKEMKEVERKW